MKEHEYIPLGAEHSVTVGRTTIIINSFADRNADKTAEDLIMQLLTSKVTNINDTIIKEEKSA